jgi:hypothetical protein
MLAAHFKHLFRLHRQLMDQSDSLAAKLLSQVPDKTREDLQYVAYRTVVICCCLWGSPCPLSQFELKVSEYC